MCPIHRIDINGLWYNIRMRLLMHLCCANCALYPLKSLLERTKPVFPAFKVTGYWFNPNIEPLDEYTRRLDAMRELERLWGLDVIYNDAHDNSLYKCAVEEITARGGTRCEACYTLRLDRTAMKAKETGADAFSTSLLISPFQKHELVREAGVKAGKIHGVEFFYEDFRSGWREGTALSRTLGLYRQNYCGCMASRREREAGRKLGRAARKAEAAVK